MFTQWFKLSQLSKLIFTEVVWYSLQWQPLYHCQPAVPAIAQRGSIGEDNTWNMEDMHECVCVDCLRPVAITILPPLFLYFFFCFSITNGELSSAEENLKTKYLKTETVSRKCALWNMHTCTHTLTLFSLPLAKLFSLGFFPIKLSHSLRSELNPYTLPQVSERSRASKTHFLPWGFKIFLEIH